MNDSFGWKEQISKTPVNSRKTAMLRPQIHNMILALFIAWMGSKLYKSMPFYAKLEIFTMLRKNAEKGEKT